MKFTKTCILACLILTAMTASAQIERQMDGLYDYMRSLNIIHITAVKSGGSADGNQRACGTRHYSISMTAFDNNATDSPEAETVRQAYAHIRTQLDSINRQSRESYLRETHRNSNDSVFFIIVIPDKRASQKPVQLPANKTTSVAPASNYIRLRYADKEETIDGLPRRRLRLTLEMACVADTIGRDDKNNRR